MPKIDAPNDPPSVRKKDTPEVAAPRYSKDTVFCTISVRICIIRPMPAPSTTMNSASSQKEVSASMVLNR